jgi:hypothetical protein
VTELKELGNGVMIPAPKEERKDTQYLGPLGPQHFMSPFVWMSSLPIEENYVRFEVFTRATWRKIPEDSILHSLLHENLKSCIFLAIQILLKMFISVNSATYNSIPIVILC